MELMKLLPDFYENNETMKQLQDIVSIETERLEEILIDTIDQCFPSSANRLLMRFERILGIEIDESKTAELRREQIYAKMTGTGTTTKAMIENVAKQYSNGEVEIIEDNRNYCFTVKFGSLGIPQNMEGFKRTIEEIKPAHLTVRYEYTYNTWDDVKRLTWEQAARYTWNEIRTVKV